jgi:RNA-directed DNA polymerase
MSLVTPTKLRNFQAKLYQKAKAEPTWRFHALYDKVWREDILLHAYRVARANDGASGVDGVTFDQIEETGQEIWLAGLRQELQTKTYRPQPVRRVMIPKPLGGERPLGIPTIRDRVVQTAAKLVLEPIFEADLEPNAYGYRQGMGAHDAIQHILRLLHSGHTHVVDADLSKYFDTIPHRDLMKIVAKRIVDGQMLRLIKMWLKAPVSVTDDGGRTTLTGGKANTCGTPQGGVISPLLANLYMNRFLKYWRMKGWPETIQAHVVSYADDFVVMTRDSAEDALELARGIMDRIGLRLNEEKTVIRDARKERFSFLGYSIGVHIFKKNGREYLTASPSEKSVARMKETISDILCPQNTAPWPEVKDQLLDSLRGWVGYFRLGTTYMAYRAVEGHLYDRIRAFLVRRHKLPTQGYKQFSRTKIVEEMGIPYLRNLAH